MLNTLFILIILEVFAMAAYLYGVENQKKTATKNFTQYYLIGVIIIFYLFELITINAWGSVFGWDSFNELSYMLVFILIFLISIRRIIWIIYIFRKIAKKPELKMLTLTKVFWISIIILIVELLIINAFAIAPNFP